VVIGIHNPGRYLRQTLESILHQDVDLELVVIEDGCTDESASLLKDLAFTDARVRVLRQEHRGLTWALAYGCHEARGQYIARQDAGDLSIPGRLATQKAAIERDSGTAFVSCWTEFCGPNLEFLHLAKAGCASPTCILDPDKPGIVVDGPTCHPSVMLRKAHYDRVGGYRPAFYYSQDWDLWFRLAEVGRFQCIQQTLYRVRVLPSGLSGDKRLQEEYARLARLTLEARQRGHSESELLEAALRLGSRSPQTSSATREASIYYFVGAALARNHDQRAMRYVYAALGRDPFFPRAWSLLALLAMRHLSPARWIERHAGEATPRKDR